MLLLLKYYRSGNAFLRSFEIITNVEKRGLKKCVSHILNPGGIGICMSCFKLILWQTHL